MKDAYQVKSIVMDESEIERSLTRIAHQILEANHGPHEIVLVGIVTRGDVLAKRLADKIAEIEGEQPPLGSLDISFYRDDFLTYLSPEVHGTHIPFSLDGKTVVLIDDVLYTGRTIRAALDALMDLGRPAPSNLRCSLTVATASFPSAPTTWVKTCPRRATRTFACSSKRSTEHLRLKFWI